MQVCSGKVEDWACLVDQTCFVHEPKDVSLMHSAHSPQYRFGPGPRYHAQVLARPGPAQWAFLVSQQGRHLIEVRLQRLVLRSLLCDCELAALLLPIEPITYNSEHYRDDQEIQPVPGCSLREPSPLPLEIVSAEYYYRGKQDRDDADPYPRNLRSSRSASRLLLLIHLVLLPAERSMPRRTA